MIGYAIDYFVVRYRNTKVQFFVDRQLSVFFFCRRLLSEVLNNPIDVGERINNFHLKTRAKSGSRLKWLTHFLITEVESHLTEIRDILGPRVGYKTGEE